MRRPRARWPSGTDGSSGSIPSTPPLDAREDVTLADDEVLLPGMVDTHVHVNEPGRTEWEGFASATRAAAAGGVTTLVDMPLNSVPPTTTLAALRAKQDAARDQIRVDVGFWGGAVPGNLADMAALHEAGVFGFKCFLIDSGVEEFAPLDAVRFAAAMDEVARLGALMLVHAEDAAHVDEARAAGSSYAGFLASRPPAAERGGDRAGRGRGPSHQGAHPSAAPEQRRGVARPACRAGRRRRPHASRPARTTCAGRRGGARRRAPSSSAARRSATRTTATRCGAAGATATSTSSCPTTRRAPPTSSWHRAARDAATSGWPGEASPRSRSPCRRCGRRRGRAATTWRTWSGGWPSHRPTGSGSLTRAGSRSAPTPTSCVLAPDVEFDVDVTRLAHRNRVSAYAGRRLTGVVRRTWLRGVPVDEYGPPGGRFLERGQR